MNKRFRTLFLMLMVALVVVSTISRLPDLKKTQSGKVSSWFYQYADILVSQAVQRWSAGTDLLKQYIGETDDFALFNIAKPELPGVNKTGRYVSMCSTNFDDRRIGNQLFNFAGMVKVAHLTNRRVAMVRHHQHGWLDQMFEVPITRVENIQRELCPCSGYGEGDALTNVTARNDFVGKSLLICGWWQNWKHTEGIEMQLRYYLRLRPYISEKVKRFFTDQHPSHWPLTPTAFRVGVHVRAGDTMKVVKFNFGYTIPKQPYFKKAMSYVLDHVVPRSKPGKEKLLVHFYVISDSIEWVKSTLGLTSLAHSLVNYSMNVDVHVTYSTNNTAAVDLALLTMCDAVIMTTGTYGWWGAWLSNKTTVYFRDWPRPGSPLGYHINRAGFFPPWWVPFSGPFYTFRRDYQSEP